MGSVDNRIVNMQFNNRDFERKANTTINTLGRLEQSLKMKNATKGLEEVDRAAKRISFDSLSNGVESIQQRFSSLGIVGMTVLQNLTNSAVNAGKRIVSALTIDPIRTGFSEYETKINAIQTILTNTQSKGTTLDEVNKALAELNEYADKTIYNFAEMTRNIGTFTAAGIDLETATTSIKGIANLAAGSGSTANQASVAMYQLSQALAAGSLKLQDWNSVVNAGMGGQLFQNALKETAKEMGIVVDETKSFRESLSTGWISTEVLTKTLTKFASDETLVEAATQVKTLTQMIDTMKESVQSGWGVSWEYIFGNKAQAAELFTAINNGFESIIQPSADARNEMLKFWNENKGRDAVINGLANAFKGLSTVFGVFKDQLKSVFSFVKMDGEKLVSISKKFETATGNFKKFLEDKEVLNNIKAIAHGFTSIISIPIELISDLKDALAPYLSKINIDSKKVLESVANFFDKTINKLDLFIDKENIFTNGIDIIANSFKKAKNFITGFFDSFKEGFNNTSNFDEWASNMSKVLGTILMPWQHIGSIIEWTQNTVKKFGEFAAPFISKFSDMFHKASKEIGSYFGKALESFDGLTGIFSSGFLAGLLVVLNKFADGVKSISEGGLFDGLTDAFSQVKEVLSAYQQDLKAKTLLKIAAAIAVLAASMLTLSTIEPERLLTASAAMAGLVGGIMGMIKIFTMMQGIKVKSLMSVATVMVEISASVFILAGAMKIISSIEPAKMIASVLTVQTLVATMTLAVKALTKDHRTFMTATKGLMSMSVAILIISKAVKTLSKLDAVALTKGVVAVGALVGIFTVMSKFNGLSGGTIKTGIALIGMATAMIILAQAVKQLSNIDFNSMMKGLLGVQVALASMTIFTKFAPKNMLGIGTGLVFVATSLVILSQAIKKMGNMEGDTLGKGLFGLGIALAEIAIALNAMKTAVGGAAALTVMALGMALLTPQLMLLSTLDLKHLVRMLAALGGSLAIFAGAGLLLGPVIPAMLGLAGAVALLGVGVAATGAGLTLIAAGLTALSVTGAAANTAIASIVKTMISMIPYAISQFGAGIIQLAGVIAAGAPAIIGAFTALLTSLLDSAIKIMPKIVETVVKFVKELLRAIAKLVPEFVDAGMKIILGFLEGISNNIGRIIEEGANVVVNFINGIASKLPDIIQAGINLLLAFIDGMTLALSEENREAFKESVLEFILTALEALFDLFIPSSETMTRIWQSGKDFLQRLIDGFNTMRGSIKNVLTDIIKGGVQSIRDRISDFYQAGVDIVMGVYNGIKSKIHKVREAMADLASAMKKKIKKDTKSNSPSKVYKEIGGDIVDGLALGIKGKVKMAVNSISNVTTAMQDAINNIDISDNMNLQPVITPVIDMSNVEKDTKRINNMLRGPIYSSNISKSLRSKDELMLTPEYNSKQEGTTFTFNQNNYSPKALNRTEIYRQTKNQFSQMKGLVTVK